MLLCNPILLTVAHGGGILGLIISRTPVDVNSLIGALMLIGIVVTNAINRKSPTKSGTEWKLEKPCEAGSDYTPN